MIDISEKFSSKGAARQMRGKVTANQVPYSRSAAVALVAVFLFLTPVQTYSGAERPHAHAMFQLVAEALHLIPSHGHPGAHHHEGDPADSEHVEYRADHPAKRTMGDRARVGAHGADPPVLTKVSLTVATFAPALLPEPALADQLIERDRLVRGDSVDIPSGHKITPDPPPPRYSQNPT